MAGPDECGWQASLQGLAAGLGIGDRVTWMGPLYGDLKWGALREAEVFALPSHNENFGISVVEALACGVPVLATPVGIAPEVLEGIEGCYCGPFELERWHAALTPLLEQSDPRVDGRAAAETYSAQRTAQRLAAAWRTLT